jgi:hypothetical protein
MLKINIRRSHGLNPYVEITVIAGNTTVNVGLFDEKERKSLAERLREIADELEGKET